MAVAETDGDAEVQRMAVVDLSGERNIAVERGPEFPVHGEIVVQILPAIALADITATGAAESAIGNHGNRGAARFVGLPGQQRLLACKIDNAARIPHAAAINVRRQHCIDPELLQQLL